jgi:hypothetical protein
MLVWHFVTPGPALWLWRETLEATHVCVCVCVDIGQNCASLCVSVPAPVPRVLRQGRSWGLEGVQSLRC